MQETSVGSLGWEDSLEQEMATDSSILAWKIHAQRNLATVHGVSRVGNDLATKQQQKQICVKDFFKMKCKISSKISFNRWIFTIYFVCVQLLSCVWLCSPMDCSLPGSSVHEIFPARLLEWVAISCSRESSQTRDRTQVSRIAGRRFNLWTTSETHVKRSPT